MNGKELIQDYGRRMADAIRAKEGSSEPIAFADFPDRIKNLKGGTIEPGTEGSAYFDPDSETAYPIIGQSSNYAEPIPIKDNFSISSSQVGVGGAMLPSGGIVLLNKAEGKIQGFIMQDNALVQSNIVHLENIYDLQCMGITSTNELVAFSGRGDTRYLDKWAYDESKKNYSKKIYHSAIYNAPFTSYVGSGTKYYANIYYLYPNPTRLRIYDVTGSSPREVFSILESDIDEDLNDSGILIEDDLIYIFGDHVSIYDIALKKQVARYQSLSIGNIYNLRAASIIDGDIYICGISPCYLIRASSNSTSNKQITITDPFVNAMCVIGDYVVIHRHKNNPPSFDGFLDFYDRINLTKIKTISYNGIGTSTVWGSLTCNYGDDTIITNGSDGYVCHRISPYYFNKKYYLKGRYLK